MIKTNRSQEEKKEIIRTYKNLYVKHQQIWDFFISQIFYRKAKKLYYKNGRAGLPLSFAKMSRQFEVSVGFLQRFIKILINKGLITHEYAKETHDPRDCKLIFLTSEAIDSIIEENKNFGTKKYANKLPYKNKEVINNINHTEGIEFKKHNDKIGAILAKIWLDETGNEKITPKKVAWLRSAFKKFTEFMGQSENAFTNFRRFLKHQLNFLNRKFNLWIALSYRAISAYIKYLGGTMAFVKKQTAQQSYRLASSYWIEKHIAPLSKNKPMSEEEKNTILTLRKQQLIARNIQTSARPKLYEKNEQLISSQNSKITDENLEDIKAKWIKLLTSPV